MNELNYILNNISVKQQIIDYRNSHKDNRILLGVVLGEFEREEKAKGRTIGEVTNAECITIIKKLIQSNNECNLVGVFMNMKTMILNFMINFNIWLLIK